MVDPLEPLLADGVIDEVVARLKSGKEADLWLVRHGAEIVAAKVYKSRQARSFKNNSAYLEGRKVRNSRTQRAMDRGSRFGQAAAEEAWKTKEADALHALHAAGVSVPRPVLFYEGVLLMEVVVDAAGRPAPRLVDARLEREQAAEMYAGLRSQVVKMLCCDLVHGDLSPYNVLLGREGPVIIDFPQVVGAAHNSQAEGFFFRDLANLRHFFEALDPALRAAAGDGREILAGLLEARADARLRAGAAAPGSATGTRAAVRASARPAAGPAGPGCTAPAAAAAAAATSTATARAAAPAPAAAAAQPAPATAPAGTAGAAAAAAPGPSTPRGGPAPAGSAGAAHSPGARRPAGPGARGRFAAAPRTGRRSPRGRTGRGADPGPGPDRAWPGPPPATARSPRRWRWWPALAEPDHVVAALPLRQPPHLARQLGPGVPGAALHLARQEGLEPRQVPLEDQQQPAPRHRAVPPVAPLQPARRRHQQLEPLAPALAEDAHLQHQRDGELVRHRRAPALQVGNLVAAEALEAGAHRANVAAAMPAPTAPGPVDGRATC